jgi:hypothetical protein
MTQVSGFGAAAGGTATSRRATMSRNGNREEAYIAHARAPRWRAS